MIKGGTIDGLTVMTTNTTRGVNDATVDGQKIDRFTATVKATSTSRYYIWVPHDEWYHRMLQ